MISIRMLKLRGDSICKPLNFIFKTCLRNGRFPLEWKNVVPIHKKGDKQTIKIYRPVSLLPICGKIFERFHYDTMFNAFSKNNLLSPNQSRFGPRNSCINQLLSINHQLIGLLIWESKFVGYSLISLKRLAKYGMRDWFLSCTKMVFAVKWLIF